MRISTIFFVLHLVAACSLPSTQSVDERAAIGNLLDNWHSAAAKADFNDYFGYFDTDAIFMGTDATEHWDVSEFKAFAKPFFDKGKAWNFTALERHIYFDPSGKVAWFDELLDTQMKICRGSGVLVKRGDNWRITQYVLSMTVPNDSVDAVVAAKTPLEDPLIQQLRGKP